MAEIDIVSAVFTGGASVSGPVSIGNKELVGIQIPSNWVTATIELQVSIDGGATFGTVLTVAGGSATPYITGSIVGGTQYYLAIDPNTLRGASMFQIVSSAAQTNNPTLPLITRLVF